MEGKKSFDKLRKRLFKNMGLKIISFVLAFVLWFVVIQIEDPQDDQSYEDVQVKLVNTELLDNQGKFYEIIEDSDKVRVTVYAPRSIIEKLRKSDIVAEADVSKLTDINTIAITYKVENATVDRIEGGHDVVRLNVEEKKSKWVRLIGDTVGEVPEGYIVSNITLDQTNIEITGPESVIDTVSYAQVKIDVSGATNSLTANVDIQLYDAESNPVDQKHVTKNVDLAYMEVEVLATKEIPVEVAYTGEAAEGYMATGVVESDRTTVTVAGTVGALANANSIVIPEERLDITGQTENLVQTINIKSYLPNNTQLADKTFDGKITATVYIEPIIEKELDVPLDNVLIFNLPAGMSAQPRGDVLNYDLTISGLGRYVNEIEAAGVTGRIDITSWMTEQGIDELAPGTYNIPVIFNLSDNVKIVTSESVPIVVSMEAATEE